MTLPTFYAENAAKCSRTFEYQLEVLEASRGGDPEDYFNFDASTLELQVSSSTNLRGQVFALRLTGTSVEDKDLTHKLSFKLKFTEQKAAQKIIAGPPIVPVIASIDY